MNNPTHAIKNYPNIYDEKKTNTVIRVNDMSAIQKSSRFIRDQNESGFDVGGENKREDERLPNKSIKELKAENKTRVKNRMFAEAKCQNEEIKRLKRE